MLEARERRLGALVAVVVFAFNALLLASLTFLAFDPQRTAFGRATGL